MEHNHVPEEYIPLTEKEIHNFIGKNLDRMASIISEEDRRFYGKTTPSYDNVPSRGYYPDEERDDSESLDTVTVLLSNILQELVAIRENTEKLMQR